MRHNSKPRQKEYNEFQKETGEDIVAGLSSISPDWGPEELLDQTGRFPLEKVASILNMSTSKIKVEADRLARQGASPVKEMGVRRTAIGWVIEMEYFRAFYLEQAVRWVRRVDPSWDGNHLLTQDGVFFLSEVCTVLPFRPGMIRSQANKADDSRKVLGIWKDEEYNAYVVDMVTFGPWIKKIWQCDVSQK